VLPKEFGPQTLHDRHERFALLLGAYSKGCSLDVLAKLVPGDGKGNAGRAGGAGQTAAILDKVALVLPSYPRQLYYEDPTPDLVDKPEVTHLDCSTVARRRRKDLFAGSMTIPREANSRVHPVPPRSIPRPDAIHDREPRVQLQQSAKPLIPLAIDHRWIATLPRRDGASDRNLFKASPLSMPSPHRRDADLELPIDYTC
jgi:hypothetical protein